MQPVTSIEPKMSGLGGQFEKNKKRSKNPRAVTFGVRKIVA